MKSDEFEITGVVELFPQKGGWYFIRVPQEYTQLTSEISTRGLVPIIARLGKTEWKTSLLPMGDGTQFIALNAKVRKSENITLGDKVRIFFRLNT